MPVLNIKTQGYNDSPARPDLAKNEAQITNLNIDDLIILQGGMKNGKTSISFFLSDAEGNVYFAETSAALFSAANSALKGAEQRFENEAR